MTPVALYANAHRYANLTRVMTMKAKPPTSDEAIAPQATAACGLIMPISALDGVSAEHWLEVRAILTDAVESISDPKFIVRIVSDADEIGIIQKRIVQNVYGADIVVCDVSGKNPNVMFELGMRLAFDKPVVIVKDDVTDYSFDTGIIEHVTYPRDLRFSRIVDFKMALAGKVLATYNAAKSPDHSPFLKNFGRFHVASLAETEVSPEKLTFEMLDDVRRELVRLARRIDAQSGSSSDVQPVDRSALLHRYIRDYLAANPERKRSELMSDGKFLGGVVRATGGRPAALGPDAVLEIVQELRSLVNSDE